jgi:hypothetical protein
MTRCDFVKLNPLDDKPTCFFLIEHCWTTTLFYSIMTNHYTTNCKTSIQKCHAINVGSSSCLIIHNPKHEAKWGEANGLE